MIEVSRPNDFTPNHAIPYIETAKATALLKTLLAAKENARKAIDINIGTLCVAAERSEQPPEQLVALYEANNNIDSSLQDVIFQILSIDESTPNKYNKVAALLEEFNIHGFDTIYNSLIELFLKDGDIPEDD